MGVGNEKDNGVSGGYDKRFNREDELRAWMREDGEYEGGKVGIEL